MFPKDLIPVDIARFELRHSRMSTIVGAQRCSHSEAALGKVEAIPHRAPHSVVLDPAHQRLVHTTLIDEILKQSPHRIVGKRGDNRRVQAEAALQPAGYVILSAAFAYFKGSRRRNSPVARVQTEHYLAQADQIPPAVFLRSLWHFPSAFIPIITIPVTVILAFIPIQMSGMSANIMSLGGIAIAIGAMIDAAVVVVEQTHKKLEHWNAEGRPGDYHQVVISAVKEVGGPSFFALLVIAVAFLPVFTLEAQEGRLFKPLAFTKTFAMAIAGVLAITLDPAMRLLFTRMDKFKFRPRWLAAIVNSVLQCAGWHDPQRRQPPHQPPPDEALPPSGRVRARTQVEDDCRRCHRYGADDPGVLQARLGVHAAAR